MMPKGSKYKAMAENYENIKLTKQQIERASNASSKVQEGKMTVAEQQWAESFEELLYAEQRGKIHDAVDAFEKLTGRTPRQAELIKINANIQTALTSNPTRAEALVRGKRKEQNYQGIRAPKSNMYDSSDYVRVMRGPVDEDDLGVEFAYNKEEMYDLAFGIKKETSPDNVAVMVNPEDGMIEAIDQARSKHRSLEKLIEDAKLSKEAKTNLIELTQAFTYEAMTYTMHGNEYMNLNYVLRGVNGSLYVQDQHDRVQTLALYLKRHTEDSYATHANIYWPDGLRDVWVFQRGPRSNIEGKAVLYASLQVPMSQPG